MTKQQEIEGHIEFFYCAKELKELGMRFEFDHVTSYQIMCRKTGLMLYECERLQEVRAYIEGYRAAKGPSISADGRPV